MKFFNSFKTLITVLIITNAFTSLHAQAPQGINYQAVVRNNGGGVVVNQNVSFRLSILDGGPNGTPQYVETQTVATNQFGLVTLAIGQGSASSGSVNNVTWSSGTKWLKVEFDINGGSNFTFMSASQFLSVPFALYANSAGSGWSLTGNNAQNNQFIGTNNSADLRFVTNGTERMTLKPNGYLGIGTNAPDARLTIEGQGDGFSTPDDRIFMRLRNTSSSNAANVMLQLLSGNSGTFTILNHHSSTYQVVNAPDYGQLWNSGKGLLLRASPASPTQDYSGNIRFFTGWNSGSPYSTFSTNERMRIEANGNIGMGTANPRSQLEIGNGDVYINNFNRGIILTSPNGNCWRVTVDDSGNLVRNAIACPN